MIDKPHVFDKVNWDEFWDHVLGFSEWVEKWKRIREEEVKKYHELS